MASTAAGAGGRRRWGGGGSGLRTALGGGGRGARGRSTLSRSRYGHHGGRAEASPYRGGRGGRHPRSSGGGAREGTRWGGQGRSRRLSGGRRGGRRGGAGVRRARRGGRRRRCRGRGFSGRALRVGAAGQRDRRRAGWFWRDGRAGREPAALGGLGALLGRLGTFGTCERCCRRRPLHRGGGRLESRREGRDLLALFLDQTFERGDLSLVLCRARAGGEGGGRCRRCPAEVALVGLEHLGCLVDVGCRGGWFVAGGGLLGEGDVLFSR